MSRKIFKYGLCTLLIAMSMHLFSQVEPNQIVRIYSGVAPGSEKWDWSESRFTTPNQTLVYNVTSPTLTVFRPEKSKSNGYGVVVCPGGAFQFLSMTYEGEDVAKELQRRGFTAFLLSYRLAHLFTTQPLRETSVNMSDKIKYENLIKPIIPLSIADGKAAVQYLKEHAQQYEIEKNKIGIMGFSAGGTVALGSAFQYTEKTRPDFVVSIYPRTKDFDNISVPANAPPLFMAAASDDAFQHDKDITGVYNRWRDAGKITEIHIYTKGGHGFGAKPELFPTNTWVDRFTEWLKVIQ